MEIEYLLLLLSPKSIALRKLESIVAKTAIRDENGKKVSKVRQVIYLNCTRYSGRGAYD